MFLHLYSDDFCKKAKRILNNPLHFEIKKQSFLESILCNLNPKCKYKRIIYKIYKKEQNFIKENIKVIEEELKTLNFSYFYYSYNNQVFHYYIDSIRDFFKIKKTGQIKKSKYLLRLIDFFYLNELLFFIENDVVEFKKIRKNFFIFPKKNYLKYIERRWFAIQWERESYMSDLVKNEKIKQYFVKNIPLNEKIKLINIFSDHLMDKAFYLQRDYISLKNKKREQYMFMKNLCTFLSILFLSKDNKIYVNNPIFSYFNIEKKFLNEIIEINKRLSLIDRAFNYENQVFTLNTDKDLYLLLRIFLVNKYKNKLSNITSKFGDIFEDYIKKYLVNNINEDYDIITDNIDYKENNKNVDIDIVLYDKKKKFYYLIQVKFTLNTRAYLKEEIKNICNNKLLKKGVFQLENVKSLLNSPKFLTNLKDRKININKNNFALMLVHTTFQYDFQTIGDVILYDWNTFRNLLKKGRIFQTYINNFRVESRELSNNETLSLENVDGVINYLMKQSNLEKRFSIFIKTPYYIPNVFNKINIVSYIK